MAQKGDTMQVKIFSMIDPFKRKKRNQQLLEDKINAWLREQPGIQVIRVEQSAGGDAFGPSEWIISIWYESK